MNDELFRVIWTLFDGEHASGKLTWLQALYFFDEARARPEFDDVLVRVIPEEHFQAAYGYTQMVESVYGLPVLPPAREVHHD